MEAEAAVADEPDAAVEAFKASVVEAESDRVENPVAVAADCSGELDEWLEPGSGGPGQPGVEVRRGERGILELVEQPQFLFEQERAVQRPVGLLDFAELGQLVDRLLIGGLQQRPAGALDPLARLGVGALVGVSFVAADLIHRALGEAHHVEGVKADVGVRDALADRLLVAAGHVDRDGLDRLLALAERDRRSAAGSGRCRRASTTRSRRCCGQRRS